MNKEALKNKFSILNKISNSQTFWRVYNKFCSFYNGFYNSFCQLCAKIKLFFICTQFSLPKNICKNKHAIVNFSIDDGICIFEDLTKNANKYKSIFDNKDLKYLKKMHKKYNLVVSFYLFYSLDVDKDGFNLGKMTDKYKEEFMQNSNWIKFGYHARDIKAYENISAQEQLNYYNKTIKQIMRITGGGHSIQTFVRLDRYCANQEQIKLLKNANNGIVGLFCADDANTQSYALTQEQTKELYKNHYFKDFTNQIIYLPSDIVLEKIKCDKEFYQLIEQNHNNDVLVAFTHEWLLNDINVKKYLNYLCKYTKATSKKFSFMS